MIVDDQCTEDAVTIIGSDPLCFDMGVLHIGYGIDKNFERPLYASIASVVKNTKSKIIFHVFGDRIAYLKKDMTTFCNELNITICLHEVDAKQFSGWATDGWSSAIYQRLVMAPIISKYSDIFLYLDADTICQVDVMNLFEENIADVIVAAVKDPDQSDRVIGKNDLSNSYFNSGVLLVNAKKWNHEHITEKICMLLSESSHAFKSYDQDALNVVLKDKVLFLDERYNFPADTNSHPFIRNLVEEASFLTPFIIHYMGKEKPWILGVNSKRDADIYLSYEKLTPYKNKPLQLPTTRREMKNCAKYMTVRLKPLLAVYWWLRYLYIKACGRK